MVAVTILTVMGVLVGVGVALPWGPPPPLPFVAAAAELISAEALETKHGIRLARISVSPAGGLVELRFTVLDAAKAQQLLLTAPRLIARDSGHALQVPDQGPWRSISLKPGASCFVLFPNARSVVKPGTRVSLAFGSVQIEPVIAM